MLLSFVCPKYFGDSTLAFAVTQLLRWPTNKDLNEGTVWTVVGRIYINEYGDGKWAEMLLIKCGSSHVHITGS